MTLHNPRTRIELSEEKTAGGKRIEFNTRRFDSFLNQSLFAGVRVELTTGQASMSEIILLDEECSFLDSLARVGGLPWMVVRVWLGYGDELGLPVFKGLLASVDHGNATSTFRFYDMGFKMRLEQKTEYHRGLDIDVIKKLALRNGLLFEDPDKTVKGLPLKGAKQEAQTDWEYASHLAQEAGLVLFVRGDTLHAKPPTRTGETTMTFERRDVLLLNSTDMHYKLPENQVGRPRRVEVRGSGRNNKRLSGFSEDSGRGTKQIIIARSFKGNSKSEAARRAQAKKELEREHTFVCSVKSLYLTDPRPDVRETILLTGMGELFSGKYLIDAVEYDFSPGTLTTSYDLYRDAHIGEVNG